MKLLKVGDGEQCLEPNMMVSSQMEGLLARAKPLGYFTGSWIGPHTSSIT